MAQHGGKPLLHRGKIRQVEVVQQIHRPSGQYLGNSAEEQAGIEFAEFDAPVYRDGLPDQRRADPDDRQDDNKHNDRQRQEGRQVRPLPGCLQYPPVQRQEHDREDGPPQNRAAERPQDPDERHRYRDHQQQEAFIFQVAHRSSPKLRRDGDARSRHWPIKVQTVGPGGARLQPPTASGSGGARICALHKIHADNKPRILYVGQPAAPRMAALAGG